MLALEYHVYIWQVSPQLSCGDTWLIWMWSKESNRFFRKIENFANREIYERSFSNPRPRINGSGFTKNVTFTDMNLKPPKWSNIYIVNRECLAFAILVICYCGHESVSRLLSFLPCPLGRQQYPPQSPLGWRVKCCLCNWTSCSPISKPWHRATLKRD